MKMGEKPITIALDDAGLILHLVLMHRYFDAIDRGEKTVEYRENTEYWRRRIVGAQKIVFHKGYTKVTMTFLIKDVIFNGDKIEIWLGARLNEP